MKKSLEMKKSLALVLSVILLLGVLTACGQATTGNNPASEASEASAVQPAAAGENKSAAEAGSSDIYKTKGSELTDFLNAFTSTEGLFEEPMNAIDSGNSAFAQVDRVSVNMAMLTLPQYDILSTEDLPKEEGTLMLSGFTGVREKSGDVVTFSSKTEYTEDQFNYKKGDIFNEEGSLNTSTNTLVLEQKRIRDGSVIVRIVLEAVILKNGTYLVQYLNVSASPTEGAEPNTTAVFKRFNQKEYSAVIADMNPDTAFTFKSIAGAGDVKPDDMASGYKITSRFEVRDGKATYTEQN
ncbi:MAG: hypothetical protein HGA22_02445 [Clostridiales bacterium]|nr:hypothetical protein [Clostridiales bacterium]